MSYIDELVTALGKEKVLLDPSEMFVYGADWSPRTPDEFLPPDVVVLPRTTRDIQRIIKTAAAAEPALTRLVAAVVERLES